MIFLCTKNFDKNFLENKELYFIDIYSNNIAPKEILVRYKTYCKDIRLNSLYSAYSFLRENKDDIVFVFDLFEDNLFDSLKCIDSFVKRRIIKNKVNFEENNYTFTSFDIKNIINIPKFFLKTKLVTNSENFFCICCSYYFFLKSKKIYIEYRE